MCCMQNIPEVQDQVWVEAFLIEKKCWKMETINAKNSSLGTSDGLGNREWKKEVLKIAFYF